MEIGLTLSGGGFRALVFHLGVLARLAQEDQLENVTYLSTVSGGSLAAGLVFVENGGTWPSSQVYLSDLLPRVRAQVTTNGLKRPLLVRQLRNILTIFDTRADDVAKLLSEQWGITSKLNELPKSPRWMINATCYETGKNWRFERFRMGDYVSGYTYDTDFPLCDAIAASAAFPGLIGPLVFNPEGRSWFRYRDERVELEQPETHLQRLTEPITPAYSPVHLWDGGVYDNLGLEGLHDFIDGWPRIEFLLVSDASGRFKSTAYSNEAAALVRMATGIMKNQIRALQSRTVLERIHNHQDMGNYLRTGNYCERILNIAWSEQIKDGTKTTAEIEQLCAGTLSEMEAAYCADLDTDIADMPVEDYELVFRHGFEVANASLHAYYSDLFEFIPYEDRKK